LTAQDIENSNAKTLPEVLAKISGVNFFDQNGSPADLSLNLRGFNTGEEVLVVVDGVKYNEIDQNDLYWSTISLKDIERIEILKGSSSAVYGSGVFGGVVNIVTNKKGANQLELAAGSYGYGRQALQFANSFDKFYFNLNGEFQKSSGYRKHADYSVGNGSLRLGWRENKDNASITYKKYNSYFSYADSLTEDELAQRRDQDSPAYDQRLIDGDQTALDLQKSINDVDLSLNVSRKSRKVNYYGRARGAWGTGYTKALSDTNGAVLQLTYLNKLTVGYEYRLGNIDSRSYELDKDTWVIGQKTDDIFSTKGEYAPYLQLFEKFGNVYLRYGVREDKIDYVTYDEFNKLRKDDKNFTKRTHSGEIGYNLRNDLAVFYSYGEAFKAPTFYDLYGPWGAGNEELTPELAKTNEVGLRLANSVHDISWSLFRTKVIDEIISNATWVNENMQETIRDGYELSYERKYKNLSWYVNYAYLKARFADSAPGGSDVSGCAIPMSPENTYAIGLRYIIDRYNFNFEHKFIDKQYAQSDNYNEYDVLPAYNYSNLRLGYQALEQLEFSLRITNLFNQVFVSRAVLGGTQLYYNPADLRTGELSLTYKF
jgi:outer membrane cobalamin receptor